VLPPGFEPRQLAGNQSGGHAGCRKPLSQKVRLSSSMGFSELRFSIFLYAKVCPHYSGIGGQATNRTTAIRDEKSPVRKKTAVAVQRLFRVGYIPWKKMANEERTNANVPNRMTILNGTDGVPRMSIMPKTVRFSAASIPGKQALTIGFISRSSTSSGIKTEWAA